MNQKAIQPKFQQSVFETLRVLNQQKKDLQIRLKHHQKYKERSQVFKVESQLEAVQSKIREYRRARKELQDQTA